MREQLDKQQQTTRQCAATRVHLPKAQLLRFVLDPQGNVVPDLKEKLPGRGVWISCESQVLAAAVKRNVFKSAFRKSCKVDPLLPNILDDLLAKASLQLLALSKKAGCVVSGFTKVDNAIVKSDIIALIHASEAAEDGRKKLDRRLHAVSRGKPYRVRIIDLFDSDQLSLALGQPNVVHAALEIGGASENFVMSAGRLQHYRTGKVSDAAA